VSWIQSHRQSALWVGLSLALPLALLLYLATLLCLQWLDYGREIERLEPRIARLAGLIASEGKLLESSGVLESRMYALIYPASTSTASAAASLQNDVRELATVAGLTLNNSQVLPPRELETLQKLAVKLRLKGDLAAVDRLLEELAGFEPLILVESIVIAPARINRRRGEREGELSIDLQLMSLREAG
jgi:general secretion pathway protein M